MTRRQLEHIIGAAATIAEDDDIIVIGSQAILGQYPSAPEDFRSRPMCIQRTVPSERA